MRNKTEAERGSTTVGQDKTRHESREIDIDSQQRRYTDKYLFSHIHGDARRGGRTMEDEK